MKIGKRLKEIRKSKGLTLFELSNLSGLSVSFLSNVEREANSPTLDNISKLCTSLNIDIAEFLSPSNQKIRKLHTKRNEFEELFDLKSGIKYELAFCGNKTYKCVCITIDENCDRTEFCVGIPEDNFIFITKGIMEIEIGGEKHILQEHDIMFIPSRIEHTYKKLCEGECVSYWFAIQPFEDQKTAILN